MGFSTQLALKSDAVPNATPPAWTPPPQRRLDGNSVRSSSAVAENDVTYSSVTVRPKTKTKAFSPVSVEDEVTYSSVHKQCMFLRKYEHNSAELETG
ncbi:hypothetical protein PO909_031564 [Leuciscus waleckii]